MSMHKIVFKKRTADKLDQQDAISFLVEETGI